MRGQTLVYLFLFIAMFYMSMTVLMNKDVLVFNVMAVCAIAVIYESDGRWSKISLAVSMLIGAYVVYS